MIDIRIPTRLPTPGLKPTKPRKTPDYTYANGSFIPHKIIVVNNAGGGFKVPARMPKY